MFEKAKVDGTYGSPGYNVAVKSLKLRFKSLAASNRGISARLRFRANTGKTLPPDGAQVVAFDRLSHIEGLARVPDLTEHNWFVFSRATESGEGAAGFLLAQMRRMSGSGGERMVAGSDVDTFDDVNVTGGEIRTFKHIPDTRHVGGIQMLGSTLLVPIESPRPRIEFYDLGDKLNPRLISLFTLPADRETAHYVSAIRLATNRVLVLVNRTDSGLFDLFLSSRGAIRPSTKWRYLGRSDFRIDAPDYHTDTDGATDFDNFSPQCASFVASQRSGRIHLMSFRQKDTSNPIAWVNWESDNVVELFVVEIRSSVLASRRPVGHLAPTRLEDARSLDPIPVAEGLIRLHKEAERRFPAQRGSKMRGGASAHTTPTGDLVVYAGPQTGKDGKLRMGEITAA